MLLPRAVALGAALCGWVIIRIALRRSVNHPITAALALTAVAGGMGDVLENLPNTGHGLLYFVNSLCGLAGLLALVEGLRREAGCAPCAPRRAALFFGLVVAVSALCAALPAPHDRLLAGSAGGTILLFAVLPLLRAGARPIGARLLVLGILVFAVARTVVEVAYLKGVTIYAVQSKLDIASAVVIGIGLAAFALEGARVGAASRTA